MQNRLCGVLALAALIWAAPGSAEPAVKPKLVVLDLASAGGVDPTVSAAMTEAVTAELARRGLFETISSKDVQTLLGLERQKQMLGCADSASSCLSELAGALGASFVMSGTVAQLGSAYQLSLQTLDSTRAQPVGRATRIARSLETLRAMVPFATAEATGTPSPEAPSRSLSYGLMGGGALAIAGGALFGIQAMSQNQLLEKELLLGNEHPNVLKPMAFYLEERERLSRDRTLALGVVGLGAALAITGFLVRPQDLTGDAASLALAPSGNGIVVAGSWR